jgi:hypothetical protein
MVLEYMQKVKECGVCYLPKPCDQTIHASTVGVHAWLRQRLRRALQPLPPPTLPPRAPNFEIAMLQTSRRRGSRGGARRRAAK